jgi:hypothetical protein
VEEEEEGGEEEAALKLRLETRILPDKVEGDGLMDCGTSYVVGSEGKQDQCCSARIGCF